MAGDVLHMPPRLAQALGEGDVFERVMALNGEVFRNVPGRRTVRVLLDSEPYFAKLHYGVGWREIFKNLLSLRLPIVSAATEWHAIQRLDAIGIPTTPAVAYGERGRNPAHLRSFVLTRDLGDIVSLETLCADWKAHPPAPRFKRRLLLAVADIAQRLHDHGLNHRDFYICHLCLDNQRLAQDDIHLYLIDLHRVGMRTAIRPVDRMKDMAALYFSAMDIGLTRRDYLRFLRAYRRRPLRELLHEERNFWQQVSRRAGQLYYKFHGRMPMPVFQAQD